MPHPDIITRCTHCREPLVVARETMQTARPVICSYCGQRAYAWQLIGRANRDVEIADYAPTFPHKPFADSPGWEAA